MEKTTAPSDGNQKYEVYHYGKEKTDLDGDTSPFLMQEGELVSLVCSPYSALAEFTVTGENSFVTEVIEPTFYASESYTDEEREVIRKRFTHEEEYAVLPVKTDKILFDNTRITDSIDIIRTAPEIYLFKNGEPKAGSRFVAVLNCTSSKFGPLYTPDATYYIKDDNTVQCICDSPLLGERYNGMPLDEFENEIMKIREDSIQDYEKKHEKDIGRLVGTENTTLLEFTVNGEVEVTERKVSFPDENADDNDPVEIYIMNDYTVPIKIDNAY